MTTEREQYLLERCLRLEARVAELEGMAVAPLLPPIERRSLYDDMPIARLQLRRRVYHNVSAADIAQMREMRRRGHNYRAIARRLHFDPSTVASYTRDVTIGREVA